MNESDFELLHGFARDGEQPAFAQLVRRHLDLVYATAFRKLQDAGAAQEVAQNVFTALARKAWRFAPDDSLPAWLYKTTLLESRNWLRGELRRRRREQTAAELGTTMNTPDDQPALRALVPLLDEALLSLREKDRAALLLRYYENHSLRELGAALGVGEDAAQKRVATALDKLTGFFRRRGFKTAGVAATAGVLQHTATSAPATVSEALVLAAGKLTPPAMLGFGALAARLGSWTKVQTAALCVALAAVPVGWQWREQHQARTEAGRVQSQLQDTQTELTTLRTQLERLNERAARLNASVATATEAAQRFTEEAKQFEAWKSRVRSLLLAEDYHWPEDSPVVRIPKKVVRQLGVTRPVSPPGVIKPEARELLGLTPQERQQLEAELQTHFAAMDGLIENHVCETNRGSLLYIPPKAVASQVWTVPALGDEVQTKADELEARLQETLGPERWPLVKAQLEMISTDSLRRILNLDASQNAQEVGVWISETGGKQTVGSGWSSRGSSFSFDGADLGLFLPRGDSGADRVEYIGSRSLPSALTGRMMAWIQQQAVARLGGAAK